MVRKSVNSQNEAFRWFCLRRHTYSPHDDVWNLERAIGLVNQVLQSLHLEKHPDKTFIGLVSKGFDFLDYQFTHTGLSPTRLTLASLTLAQQTITNFTTKLSRLYEQWHSAQRTA